MGEIIPLTIPTPLARGERPRGKSGRTDAERLAILDHIDAASGAAQSGQATGEGGEPPDDYLNDLICDIPPDTVPSQMDMDRMKSFIAHAQSGEPKGVA